MEPVVGFEPVSLSPYYQCAALPLSYTGVPTQCGRRGKCRRMQEAPLKRRGFAGPCCVALKPPMTVFLMKYLSLILALACSPLSAVARGKPSVPPVGNTIAGTLTSSLKPEQSRESTGCRADARHAALRPNPDGAESWLYARERGSGRGRHGLLGAGLSCVAKARAAGVPRQSNDMYEWTWKAGTFRACNGRSMDTFEFADLRPGDLLFWVNSTRDGKTNRDPPITHVMFYLGKRTADGHRIAVGASDGRTYDGQRRCGVSVFDFRLPSPGSEARFIGYARVPDGKRRWKNPRNRSPHLPLPKSRRQRGRRRRSRPAGVLPVDLTRACR